MRQGQALGEGLDEQQHGFKVRGALYYIPAAAIIAVMWAWWLLEQTTNWRITSSGVANSEPIPILIPLIATVLAVPVAVILYRRALGIVANGVPVLATVVAVGGTVNSMRDVEFEYLFEGQSYTMNKSFSARTADGYSQGSELEVLVDRRNPKKVLVK